MFIFVSEEVDRYVVRARKQTWDSTKVQSCLDSPADHRVAHSSTTAHGTAAAIKSNGLEDGTQTNCESHATEQYLLKTGCMSVTKRRDSSAGIGKQKIERVCYKDTQW